MDLLSEINDLIHLEVEKTMKKQKENFDSALHELQKRVIKLEHDHDDLEQYQPVITTGIYVLHKITIALKFMSYINSDLLIPAKN